MAQNRLDSDGLLYLWQKIKNVFAAKTDVPDAATASPVMDGTAAVGSSSKYAKEDHVHPSDTNKVDKVNGKGLSENDFTDALKSKLDGIATGAEANVQSDWNENDTSSKAYIANKPTIPAGVVVDSSLSSSSTNAIQNSAVYTALSNKVDSSDVGSNSGICPLNASGKVDSSYLPGYVDDVIEVYPISEATELTSGWLTDTSGGSTAITPESGKIYILLAASTTYAVNTEFRWTGTAYSQIYDGGTTPITNAQIDTILAT